jgi:hypothetical protein
MTDRWRLIDGAQLYDMPADREQRKDISSEHPEVVSCLRGEYERWWELVSAQFDAEVPISLGADAATTTVLTCHDWRNDNCDCPWNQSHIRQGMIANGYWEVMVEVDGDYLIELRRWPETVSRPLTAGVDGDDVTWRKDAVPEADWAHYAGGKALPLTEARLRNGEQEYSCAIGPADAAAVFRVALKPGPAHLQTWLTDGNDLEVGAYYVIVLRLDYNEN